MKIGVQLFGVLDSRPGQTLSFLEKLTEKGRTLVEPCIILEPISPDVACDLAKLVVGG